MISSDDGRRLLLDTFNHSSSYIQFTQSGFELTVDDTEGIEVKVMHIYSLDITILDLMVLLYKISSGGRSIMTSVRLGPQAYQAVLRFVCRKLRIT